MLGKLDHEIYGDGKIMICLSVHDALRHLGCDRASVEYISEILPSDSRRANIFVFVPSSARALLALSRGVVEWCPPGRDRLFHLESSMAYPPDMDVLLYSLRRSCGEYAPIDEEPIHLFRSTRAEETEYDDRSTFDIEEESLLTWMSYLTSMFTWTGALVFVESEDYVRVWDGYLEFSSSNFTRVEEICALASEFGFKTESTRPWP